MIHGYKPSGCQLKSIGEQTAQEAGSLRLLLKERTATYSFKQLGGHIIVDLSSNAVIAGSPFELSLDKVEEWLAYLNE